MTQTGSLPSERTDSTTKQASPLLIVAIAWLLVGVRVDLFSLGGSSVRLEDLILAAIAVYVAPQVRLLLRDPLHVVMLLLSVGSGLSVILGVAADRIDPAVGLLYALRPLEYWLIFAALVPARGRLSMSEPVLRQLIYAVVCIQVAAAAAQILAGLSFGFSKFSVERGAGLTAGPYELSAICVIGGLYALGKGNPPIFAIGTLGILLSASRISLVAYAVGALFLALAVVFKNRPARRIAPGTALAGLAGLSVCVMLAASPWLNTLAGPVSDRLSNTSVSSTWADARKIASLVPTPRTSDQYMRIAYGTISNIQEGPSADNSSLIRFYRWNLLLFTSDEEGAFLFGLGPSFPGPSVDGAVLRIYVEVGAIGLALWATLSLLLFRRVDAAGKAALIGTAIGSLFIDLPFAMRVSIMLLVVLAATQVRPKEAND